MDIASLYRSRDWNVERAGLSICPLSPSAVRLQEAHPWEIHGQQDNNWYKLKLHCRVLCSLEKGLLLGRAINFEVPAPTDEWEL